ncbi:hypothetical protein [Pseudomonas sp. NPDC012596]|uniref:hypothetical protein n=1 Tax=Pseudomonas sp. NPDC012596 TaxID=3364419 RepID=UPI0036A4CB24
MTHYTNDNLKSALSSIAKGSITECTENSYSVYQYLEEYGYIRGEVSGLNRYQRKHLTLTPAGQQKLNQLQANVCK